MDWDAGSAGEGGFWRRFQAAAQLHPARALPECFDRRRARDQFADVDIESGTAAVTIRSVTVGTDGPNTDGCDPDSCRDV